MPSPAQPSNPCPPLIRALIADPACYDHPVGRIELVETHISWVLLTGNYAYKIKKPVSLGFLDFGTLQQRHQDCIAELRLNRRLARDYYLEVVGIIGTPEAPRIKGQGEAFEYAVKMRQFPVDATLDRMAARGELSEAHIDALAARVAHFHLYECDTAQADSPWGEPAAVAHPVAENFRTLFDNLPDAAVRERLARLERWFDAEHVRLAPSMAARKAGGRVRECHGDLHLANMAWVDGEPVIFDCLEFNPQLRWTDVISEVAFCYMDLMHRGYDALASRFLNAWLEATGDYQGVELLRYYAAYRALVRAKVAALRAAQLTDKSAALLDAASCLLLAEGIVAPPAPLLCITRGLSGSGKTTLSQRLLQSCGMIRLRSDVERKRLAGLGALEKGGAALYSEDFSLRTYRHLAMLAEALLVAGWPVIVDAAFLARSLRDPFRELAARLGVDFQILEIRADPQILRERIIRREASGLDASEADLRVLQRQLETYEPLGDDERQYMRRIEVTSGR